LILSYERTGIVPPAWENKPEITPEVEFYLWSFNTLSRYRVKSLGGMGGGYGSITWDMVRDFCTLVGFSKPDEIFLMLEVIAACDQVYLEYQAKSAERKAKSQKKPIGKARR